MVFSMRYAGITPTPATLRVTIDDRYTTDKPVDQALSGGGDEVEGVEVRPDTLFIKPVRRPRAGMEMGGP